MENNIILPKKSRIQELIDNINQAKDEFDEKEFLLDKNHEFCQAVQQFSPKSHLFIDEDDWKAHGSPVWKETDEYMYWLKCCRDEIVNNRLPEIKAKKANSGDLSAFQMSIAEFADELKFEDELEMMKFDKVYYDYLEWHLNKQKETIDRFEKGLVTITQKDILQYELDYELGKTALDYVPKENVEGLVKLNK